MWNQIRENLYNTLSLQSPSNAVNKHPQVLSTTHHDDEVSFFVAHRYILLPLLLILFWPIILTIAAASFSASAWLFWLIIGAVFGLLQLLYVLYNFLMITVDLMGLTLLKSFALIRSYVRKYGYKMYNYNSRNSRNEAGKNKLFRRRKEWREEVDKAKSFQQYCEIELYEPSSQQLIDESKEKEEHLDQDSKNNSWDTNAAAEHHVNLETATPRTFFGLRKKLNHKSNGTQDRTQQSIHQSPSSTTTKNPTSPPSPLRKIHSSLDLKPAASSNHSPVKRVSSTASLPNNSDHDVLDHQYPEWSKIVRQDMGMNGDMLLTTTNRLREARMQAMTSNSNGGKDDTSSLKFLLSGIIKRNHLSIDDALIADCRSVAERGQHSLHKETREAIDSYGEEIERCLALLASGPVNLNDSSNNMAKDDKLTREKVMAKQLEELDKRYTLVKRMKQNMGHTALMLSGGGAIAMYHLGTVKALVESKLYDQIHVISGTSGGSIGAAMCAIKKPEELLSDICVNTVSTDYLRTGEMKEKNIRWFPDLWDMGKYWLKHGVLADSSEFKRCCEFYYKDITFEEAFEMTHKHVCITVTASRASAGSGVQRLLLNHISTPNVTLASAVVASCSLPGFMKSTKLMIKDSRGKQMPFEVDGVEWIDGSVQADLPFKRISTLFNVSNFVVAQVNFHVVPFLNKAHHPNINTLYWKLFQICMWDVKNRVLNLSNLGLFPRLFGQDVTKVFKQKYYGNLTLVPRFTTMHIFGLRAFQNPSVADMDIYLQDGQIAAWPYLRVLKEMLRLEMSIDCCQGKLKQRMNSLEMQSEHRLDSTDDADSLSLSSATAYRAARLPGLGREAELLKEKNDALKQEVAQLRRQIVRYQRALGISSLPPSTADSRNHGPLVGQFVSVRVEEEEVERKEK